MRLVKVMKKYSPQTNLLLYKKKASTLYHSISLFIWPLNSTVVYKQYKRGQTALRDRYAKKWRLRAQRILLSWFPAECGASGTLVFIKIHPRPRNYSKRSKYGLKQWCYITSAVITLVQKLYHRLLQTTHIGLYRYLLARCSTVGYFHYTPRVAGSKPDQVS